MQPMERLLVQEARSVWDNPRVRRAVRVAFYAAAGFALSYAGGHLAALVALPQAAPYLDNPVVMTLATAAIGAADKGLRDRESREDVTGQVAALEAAAGAAVHAVLGGVQAGQAQAAPPAPPVVVNAPVVAPPAAAVAPLPGRPGQH